MTSQFERHEKAAAAKAVREQLYQYKEKRRPKCPTCEEKRKFFWVKCCECGNYGCVMCMTFCKHCKERTCCANRDWHGNTMCIKKHLERCPMPIPPEIDEPELPSVKWDQMEFETLERVVETVMGVWYRTAIVKAEEQFPKLQRKANQ